MSENRRQFLTEHFVRKGSGAFRDPRADDLIRFYAVEGSKMRDRDFREISDFARAMLKNPQFSFRGRTYGSMVRLCQEWHRMVYSGRVREFRCWSGVFEPWSQARNGWIVRAIELSNNRALRDEGLRQRHCVFSYTSDCTSGQSAIVSLRWFALDIEHVPARLTLEVNRHIRCVEQIRGRMNRRATEEEMKVVRAWAGDHGLSIDRYAN